MAERWLSTTIPTLGLIALSALVAYAAVLLFTRQLGLRSFAQMSAFDFAMSVAIGTLMASTIVSGSVSLAEGVFALACLYLLQAAIGTARSRSRRASRLVDNQPLLLMDGSEILHQNLASARVTEEDLYSKLREANVRNLDEVLVVVMETTGDVSVVHTSGGEDVELDRSLLRGVVDGDGDPLV